MQQIDGFDLILSQKQASEIHDHGVGFAYLITNTINNKKYIGIAKNPNRRFLRHKADAKNGKNHLLYKAMRKYGCENFEMKVLASSKTWNDLLALERLLVVQHQSFWKTGFGYNLTLGGEGILGHRHTAETLERMSKANSRGPMSEETKAKLRGQKRTEETKLKLGKAKKGSIVTEQTRLKISEKLKARIWTDEQKAATKNRLQSKESVEKRNKSNAGKTIPEETRLKMIAAKSGGILRSVITPDGVFPHINAAIAYYKMKPNTARKWLQFGTYGWKYGEGIKI